MERVITLLKKKLHKEMMQFKKLENFNAVLAINHWNIGPKPEVDEDMIAQLNRAIKVLETLEACPCSDGEWVPVTDTVY
jgi:hypothetical protein